MRKILRTTDIKQRIGFSDYACDITDLTTAFGIDGCTVEDDLGLLATVNRGYFLAVADDGKYLG